VLLVAFGSASSLRGRTFSWKQFAMSDALQQLLNTFDALSEGDKHQAAIEIIRRVSKEAVGDVPESALVQAADDLFRVLDDDE